MGDGRRVPEFAKLTEADLREVWRHEAHDFTPWLAGNLDRLAEATGVPLEAEATESRVGEFAADILATGPEGQSVLIENQLEHSDHSHLGQIMTYLAGLDAQIVVWVARDFSDPHLSAIQWLNRNTEDEFAFFAVKLRVVRISDSPLAAVFEVIAKPNNWERRVRWEGAGPRAENVRRYRRFWTHYAGRHPRDGVRPKHGSANVWIRPRIVHFADIRHRVVGEPAMIRRVSDIRPHRQSLLDEPGVDVVGRQLPIQRTEIILLSDLDAPIGGYPAEALFQHGPTKGGCGVLVLAVEEVVGHGKKVREHICGNESSHVGQESVAKILVYRPQDADAGFHVVGKALVNFTFEVDHVCMPTVEEISQKR